MEGPTLSAPMFWLLVVVGVVIILACLGAVGVAVAIFLKRLKRIRAMPDPPFDPHSIQGPHASTPAYPPPTPYAQPTPPPPTPYAQPTPPPPTPYAQPTPPPPTPAGPPAGPPAGGTHIMASGSAGTPGFAADAASTRVLSSGAAGASGFSKDVAPVGLGSVTCTSGAIAGQRFDIRPEGIYIGRDGSLAQVVIPDGRISKRHVWIGPRQGRVAVVDQGSTNGTFLNTPGSQRVTEAFLNPGDTIILSEADVARFRYEK